MHPRPTKWVTIGRAVVYYAQEVYAFSAGIKCRHCMSIRTKPTTLLQISCKLMCNSKAIFGSITGIDNTCHLSRVEVGGGGAIFLTNKKIGFVDENGCFFILSKKESSGSAREVNLEREGKYLALPEEKKRLPRSKKG